MLTQKQVIDYMRAPSFWVGVFLIGIGSLSLLYIGLSIIQLIQLPGESGLVQWLVLNVNDNNLVLSGQVNENAFDFHASPVIQYIFLGLIGLKIISILTTIVNTLISGGIKLITFSGFAVNEECDKGGSSIDQFHDSD